MDPNLCFEYQQLMSLYSHNKKSVTDKQQKQLELKKNDSKRQEKQQTKKENVSKVFENNNLNVEEVPAQTKNQSNKTHNLEKSKQQFKRNVTKCSSLVHCNCENKCVENKPDTYIIYYEGGTGIISK